jgi:hypothetical protein
MAPWLINHWCRCVQGPGLKDIKAIVTLKY